MAIFQPSPTNQPWPLVWPGSSIRKPKVRACFLYVYDLCVYIYMMLLTAFYASYAWYNKKWHPWKVIVNKLHWSRINGSTYGSRIIFCLAIYTWCVPYAASDVVVSLGQSPQIVRSTMWAQHIHTHKYSIARYICHTQRDEPPTFCIVALSGRLNRKHNGSPHT